MQMNSTNNKLTANKNTVRDVGSELFVRIAMHMITPNTRQITLRCETNIFNLYRHMAEVELEVDEDSFQLHSGLIRPTNAQQSSGTSTKSRDPDNSALQASAVHLFGYRFKSILVLQSIFLFAMKRLS